MRRPQITLPQAVTDRLPDAISQRLPSTGNSRRITGKRVAIGGGALAVLALVIKAGANAARKRYDTGTAQVTQLVNYSDGVIVVLDNDKLFWVPVETGIVLKTYLGDGAPALPYKIDRFRRHVKSGLAVGTVNTDTTGLDD
jgi:hypothetical protein